MRTFQRLNAAAMRTAAPTVVVVIAVFFLITFTQVEPWERRVTLVTWAGAIVAFLWGVMKYADTKDQANKQAFLLEQLKLCFEASDAAASLVTERNGEKWEIARQTFWRLYHGKLCIVEDSDVAAAMYQLGKVIPLPEAPRPDRLPITDRETRTCRSSWLIRHVSSFSNVGTSNSAP